MQPHQEVFAQLNVQKYRAGEEFSIRWPVQKPFRPKDLLFFGATPETQLQSVRIATLEQLVRPFKVLEVLSVPSFGIEELLTWVDRKPELDRLEHAKATQEIKLVNDNPPVRQLQTASAGQYIQLILMGPIEHVAVLGLAVD